MNVKGLKIEDILLMDLNKLTEKELRQVTTRLVSAANKRIKRAKKSDKPTPHEVEKVRGGKFSTKGTKNINELRKVTATVKNFLKSETASLRGQARTRKRVEKGLKKAGVNLKGVDYNEFFRKYEQLKEISPIISNKELKYKVMNEISQQLKDGEDVSIQKLVDELNKIYEADEEANNSISSFFDVGQNL